MYVVYNKKVIICDDIEIISNRKYYNKLSNLLRDFPEAKKDSHEIDCFNSGIYYDKVIVEDSASSKEMSEKEEK